MPEQPATDPSFRRLRPSAPVHRTVQEEIRSYVLTNKLQPGDPLKPEAELARQFGVSRSSVREAVKALESTGVLEIRKGSGTYVRDFSFAPLFDHLPYGLMVGTRVLRDLLVLRKALESAMADDAMAALRPETVDELRRVLAEMGERAARGEGYAVQDREFHRLLFVDLDNEMLLHLFDLFWQAFHRSSEAIPDHDLLAGYRSHEEIFDAMLSGDTERARDAIRRHYVDIEERLEA
ncbi:FadR/GntR family transcriptional regulator [Kribbella amoyensis]|uniref:FadR/GntR family transcriptional regulator n=1 Tax=Kribbella amoyensis TaxID=996641 RepID=UPI00192E0368|nr:FadR/GntR family transcriptional regulator [Kribbella amoyensis]